MRPYDALAFLALYLAYYFSSTPTTPRAPKGKIERCGALAAAASVPFRPRRSRALAPARVLTSAPAMQVLTAYSIWNSAPMAFRLNSAARVPLRGRRSRSSPARIDPQPRIGSAIRRSLADSSAFSMDCAAIDCRWGQIGVSR